MTVRSSPATARKRRQEALVMKAVREQVMERDGFRCRVYDPHASPAMWCFDTLEWAHFGPVTRAKTRKMAPAVRHTTAGSLALCGKHHRLYDAHRLTITALDPTLGCDGPLVFTLKDK